MPAADVPEPVPDFAPKLAARASTARMIRRDGRQSRRRSARSCGRDVQGRQAEGRRRVPPRGPRPQFRDVPRLGSFFGGPGCGGAAPPRPVRSIAVHPRRVRDPQKPEAPFQEEAGGGPLEGRSGSSPSGRRSKARNIGRSAQKLGRRSAPSFAAIAVHLDAALADDGA